MNTQLTWDLRARRIYLQRLKSERAEAESKLLDLLSNGTRPSDPVMRSTQDAIRWYDAQIFDQERRLRAEDSAQPASGVDAAGNFYQEDRSIVDPNVRFQRFIDYLYAMKDSAARIVLDSFNFRRGCNWQTLNPMVAGWIAWYNARERGENPSWPREFLPQGYNGFDFVFYRFANPLGLHFVFPRIFRPAYLKGRGGDIFYPDVSAHDLVLALQKCALFEDQFKEWKKIDSYTPELDQALDEYAKPENERYRSDYAATNFHAILPMVRELIEKRLKGAFPSPAEIQRQVAENARASSEEEVMRRMRSGMPASRPNAAGNFYEDDPLVTDARARLKRFVDFLDATHDSACSIVADSFEFMKNKSPAKIREAIRALVMWHNAREQGENPPPPFDYLPPKYGKPGGVAAAGRFFVSQIPKNANYSVDSVWREFIDWLEDNGPLDMYIRMRNTWKHLSHDTIPGTRFPRPYEDFLRVALKKNIQYYNEMENMNNGPPAPLFAKYTAPGYETMESRFGGPPRWEAAGEFDTLPLVERQLARNMFPAVLNYATDAGANGLRPGTTIPQLRSAIERAQTMLAPTAELAAKLEAIHVAPMHRLQQIARFVLPIFGRHMDRLSGAHADAPAVAPTGYVPQPGFASAGQFGVDGAAPARGQ